MIKNSHSKLSFYFVTLVLLSVLTSCTSQQLNCQTNWLITGFFTPLESQFKESLSQTISIEKLGKKKFSQGFLKSVKLEGWGKTRFGWYLGYYNQQWHKEVSALNSLGYPLKIGDIAVDTKIIAKGTVVQIKSLEPLLNIKQFNAVDVGSAIRNKHIDIYTGEGIDAKYLSYQVTGRHVVCFNRVGGAPVLSAK